MRPLEGLGKYVYMYICIYLFELHIPFVQKMRIKTADKEPHKTLNISSIYWFGSGMATSRTLFNYPGFDLVHAFVCLGLAFFSFWGGACSDRKGLQKMIIHTWSRVKANENNSNG